MKRFLKFCSILISATLIIVIIIACADFDETEDGFKTSFFSQHTMIETTDDHQYKPFFRIVSEPFKATDPAVNLNDKNIDFWYVYFEKKVSRNELENLLYKTEIKSIDHLIFYIKDNTYSKIPQSLKSYTLCNKIDQNKSIEFLHYLGFAKRCEAYSITYENQWDQAENSKTNRGNIQDLITGGLVAVSKPKTPAIMERYLFQLVRLYFHKAQQANGNYNEAIQYYEKIKNQFTEDALIRYRCMGYAAAAYYKKADYSNANYLYSLMYDHCPEMKVVAQFSFRPMNESDFAACLAKAKNDREKCVLWHLLGLYADEFRAIQRIYEINPKSDLLNVLLVRHISIIEEYSLPNNWYDDDTKVKTQTTIYKDSIYQFIPERLQNERIAQLKKICDAENTQRPYLWTLAYAYIATIKNDTQLAKTYLDKSIQLNPTNKLLQAQVRVCHLLLKANNLQTITRQTEADLLNDLNFVDLLDPDIFYKDDIKLYVWKRLAEQYVKQKENEKAILCQANFIHTYYNDSTNINQMIAYLSNSNHSPFEQYIIEQYPYKLSDFYELKGIRLTYQGKIESAIIAFSQANSGNDTLLGNPFNIHIKDCHDCDHAAIQKRKFTKLQLVKEIKYMENIAATTKSYSDYFLLANAYYNITYFGNARVFYKTPIDELHLYEQYDFPFANAYFYPSAADMHIFDCSKAEKYYLLAREHTSDPELKAKCTFMAAKCEQNKFYMNKPKGYSGDFKAGNYFAELFRAYKNTKYYNEILKECSYFKTYSSM